MKYDNYLETIAQRFNAYLDEIAAEHNFEHGPEFEIAICKTFRRALPSKYGVCRGYLVDADGRKAGDDIIIYNHERFPSLRIIGNEDFSQKQHIPIEAAYAYIEAKNSLTLAGERATLPKAVKQVGDVKSLVENREAVKISTAIDPYIVFTHLRQVRRSHWPSLLNPFFAAIISKQVRKAEGSPPLVGAEVRTELDGLQLPDDHPVDLIVAGEDVVGLPFVKDETEKKDTYHSPFSLPESHIRLEERPQLAFAIGFCSLIYALETIRLGVMPWPAIISDALRFEGRS